MNENKYPLINQTIHKIILFQPNKHTHTYTQLIHTTNLHGLTTLLDIARPARRPTHSTDGGRLVHAVAIDALIVGANIAVVAFARRVTRADDWTATQQRRQEIQE